MSKRRKRLRRRSHSVHEEVELNMAAMLDMAFQLLAFFILTFQPSGVETQISMRMPKLASVTQDSMLDAPTDEEFELKYPLILTVKGGDEGISQITVGSEQVGGGDASSMIARIGSIVSNMLAKGTIDQIQLQVDEDVHYEWLIQIIDVCTQQRLLSGEPMTNITVATIPK